MVSTHPYFRRFPRTYPTNAHPIFTVQQPIRGIPDDCITKLSNFIQAEARQSRGTEIVFRVSKFLNQLILTISPLLPQSRSFDPTIVLFLLILTTIIYRSLLLRKTGLPLISRLLLKLSVLWRRR